MVRAQEQGEDAPAAGAAREKDEEQAGEGDAEARGAPVSEEQLAEDWDTGVVGRR